MNILISLLRNKVDSTKKKSESSGRERSPRSERAIMVTALNHITCPEVSPMATGLQNYNSWRFMLAVMALLSGFTFSPLEECIRCIVLTQRRFV